VKRSKETIMSAFLSGALGALAVLAALALGVRARFAARRRRWRHGVPRRGLRFLARRIGARPEQEEVLSAEADALARELSALREEARAVRSTLADLLAAPSLDAAALRAALDRPLARLSEVRARVEATFARVHETLEPAQREALAALVRCGPHARPHAA
jgi:uncharacterized membrane protein